MSMSSMSQFWMTRLYNYITPPWPNKEVISQVRHCGGKDSLLPAYRCIFQSWRMSNDPLNSDALISNHDLVLALFVGVAVLWYLQGRLREKLVGNVRTASQNPYPIYDQNLWFSMPCFRPALCLSPWFKPMLKASWRAFVDQSYQ